MLVKTRSRAEKLACAISAVQEVLDALGVQQRNLLLVLQHSLQVITRDAALSTLFPDNVLHIQYHALLEGMQQIAEVL